MNPGLKPGSGIPFRNPAKNIGPLDADAVARLVGTVGDLAVTVDRDAVVSDVAFPGGDPTGNGPDKWVGRVLRDLVTVESLPKLVEITTAAAAGEQPRWRQVNHPSASGDVPIRYLGVAGADGGMVLIGQDLRAQAALQQRLIQAQQSLERDYLRLRQTEARYRMLFDLDSDPVMVVDAESRRIREANPAATALAGVKPGALVGRSLVGLFEPNDQDKVLAYLGSVSVAEGIEPVPAVYSATRTTVSVAATPFRQDRASFYLVRLQAGEAAIAEAAELGQLRDLIDRMPDAFVVTDDNLRIESANPAFLDMSQDVSAARIKGTSLSNYLGRSAIDIDLIVDQLRAHGSVRSMATVLRGKDGTIEDVEVSAAVGAQDSYAFTIRSIGRRARDLPPADRDMPRSVEQLTELVGRMSLKDIVRESTDLIERLCIEAALEYTSDNRASAAEILGVSRQSLYSKLHRHGLGNLVPDEE